MVKLPDQAEEGRAERRSRSTPSNHHNWGVRFGRQRREAAFMEPRGLQHLEELAQRTVMLMEMHSTSSENNHQRAMDLLRLQYNMNFIVLCEKCHGPHVIDEILAPER